MYPMIKWRHPCKTCLRYTPRGVIRRTKNAIAKQKNVLMNGKNWLKEVIDVITYSRRGNPTLIFGRNLRKKKSAISISANLEANERKTLTINGRTVTVKRAASKTAERDERAEWL